MSKNTGLLLIIWNVALTALAAWGLMRKPATAGGPERESADPIIASTTPVDTTALADARIAFFFMDSLRENLDMIQDKMKHLRAEGEKMEATWARELGKAQQEFQTLMEKDHTYSTQAERAADERRLQELQENIARLKDESETRMDRLQRDMLVSVAGELTDHLEEYNRSRGFDYIISIEPDGQVWVGNKGLDISADLIEGLNARYREQKAAGKN
jgi:outer membrane protein